MSKNKTVDCVFVFDTTGSMYPVLATVRDKIKSVAQYLNQHIPNLRIGLLAHGDWCDHSDVINSHPLTESSTRLDKICQKIYTLPKTNGGDYDECYEYALNELRKFDWKADIKFAIMIGDDTEHAAVDYTKFGKYYGYQTKFNGEPTCEYQLKELNKSGIMVYPIQAFPNNKLKLRLSDTKVSSSINDFWNNLAKQQNLPLLKLDNMDDINGIIMAVCMKENDTLNVYKNEIVQSGTCTSGIMNAIELLESTPAKKVQSSYIYHTNLSNKTLTLEQMLVDKYYRDVDYYCEYVSRTKISPTREVLAIKCNGDLLDNKETRKLLNLDNSMTVERVPKYDRSTYKVFVKIPNYGYKIKPGVTVLAIKR